MSISAGFELDLLKTVENCMLYVPGYENVNLLSPLLIETPFDSYVELTFITLGKLAVGFN